MCTARGSPGAGNPFGVTRWPSGVSHGQGGVCHPSSHVGVPAPASGGPQGAHTTERGHRSRQPPPSSSQHSGGPAVTWGGRMLRKWHALAHPSCGRPQGHHLQANAAKQNPGAGLPGTPGCRTLQTGPLGRPEKVLEADRRGRTPHRGRTPGLARHRGQGVPRALGVILTRQEEGSPSRRHHPKKKRADGQPS